LHYWQADPEAAIPQSSVLGIIDSLNQEIGELSGELDQLLMRKKEL
jgi:hypothetical protein